MGYILWLCLTVRLFIVDLPINSMVIFHSYVNVYQRVRYDVSPNGTQRSFTKPKKNHQ